MFYYNNSTALEQEFKKLKAKFHSLESKLANQERIISNLTQDTAKNKQFTRPDPPIWDGEWGYTHDYNLDDWIYKMHVKLQHPPLSDFDKETQIQYVVSRLGGEAFDHVKCRLPGGSRLGFGASSENEFQNASEVLAALRKAYNPDKSKGQKGQDCSAPLNLLECGSE